MWPVWVWTSKELSFLNKEPFKTVPVQRRVGSCGSLGCEEVELCHLIGGSHKTEAETCRVGREVLCSWEELFWSFLTQHGPKGVEGLGTVCLFCLKTKLKLQKGGRSFSCSAFPEPLVKEAFLVGLEPPYMMLPCGYWASLSFVAAFLSFGSGWTSCLPGAWCFKGSWLWSSGLADGPGRTQHISMERRYLFFSAYKWMLSLWCCFLWPVYHPCESGGLD